MEPLHRQSGAVAQHGSVRRPRPRAPGHHDVARAEVLGGRHQVGELDLDDRLLEQRDGRQPVVRRPQPLRPPAPVLRGAAAGLAPSAAAAATALALPGATPEEEGEEQRRGGSEHPRGDDDAEARAAQRAAASRGHGAAAQALVTGEGVLPERGELGRDLAVEPVVGEVERLEAVEAAEGVGDLAGEGVAGELERVEEAAVGELAGELAGELVPGEVEVDDERDPVAERGRDNPHQRVVGEVERGGGAAELQRGGDPALEAEPGEREADDARLLRVPARHPRQQAQGSRRGVAEAPRREAPVRVPELGLHLLEAPHVVLPGRRRLRRRRRGCEEDREEEEEGRRRGRHGGGGGGEWFDQVGRPDCGGVERMMGGGAGFGGVGLGCAALRRGGGGVGFWWKKKREMRMRLGRSDRATVVVTTVPVVVSDSARGVVRFFWPGSFPLGRFSGSTTRVLL